MNRREFLGTAVAAGCLSGNMSGAPQKDVVQAKAQPFALRDVQLLESEWTALVEKNRQYLHALEPDRLLHTFRLTAGLPSTAEPPGGWEGPGVELRGHFLGHYLSGCAQMSVTARDPEIKANADGIVAKLARCKQANG